MIIPSPGSSLLQGLSDVAWSRDGGLVATASDDKTLKLWDPSSGRCVRTLEGHTHYVLCCDFNACGNMLVRHRAASMTGNGPASPLALNNQFAHCSAAQLTLWLCLSHCRQGFSHCHDPPPQ